MVQPENADTAHFWHPFTQMKEYSALPRLMIERGQGNWLIDTQGKRYLDATASIWTNVHGHNDPDLNGAIIRQLSKVAHSTSLGLGNPTTAALAAKLASISPGSLNHVFFSDNGSGAVEVALKLSFQFWQLTGHPEKKHVIALQNAYHGDTFGTMSVGDCGLFHERFAPWCFPVRRIPGPVHREAGGIITESDPSQSLKALELLLQQSAHETAALILEPWVQGAGGMILQPKGYLPEVARLCHSHGIHLILDEVFVGFGRCGPLLVCSEENVVPDFLCLAKGLTGGYMPLAATVTTDTLYRAFWGEIDQWRTFYHGHTFTGNPLAAAVSLENIAKLEPLIASGDLARRMDYFTSEIRDRCLGHPAFPEISQRGFAARLCLPKGFPVNVRAGMRVAIAARNHGVIVRPLGDSLLLVPPLTLSPGETDFMLDGVISAAESTLHSLKTFPI